MPYTVGTSAYPCNVRCSDFGYRYVTPLGNVITMLPGTGAPLWNGTGMTMSAANAMRMEPIL